MRVVVPAESKAGEKRVALLPDIISKLTKAGLSVSIESGAGINAGASVLYTDVWMSMGDPEADRIEKEKTLASYSISDELMGLASKDAIFMHCLPAHRGQEVSASVMDGPASKIWRQAYHRRTTIQAILYHSLRGELKGRI